MRLSRNDPDDHSTAVLVSFIDGVVEPAPDRPRHAGAKAPDDFRTGAADIAFAMHLVADQR
jgi:hypothetical protein